MSVYTEVIESVKTTICTQQEFCTDCPMRIGCKIRQGFYDEDTYYTSSRDSNIATLRYAVSIGMNFYSAIVTINDGTIAMNKKRKREMELYPTYSEK